jgi:hypothetical protein
MFSRRRFIECGTAGSLAGAFAAWGLPREAAASSAVPGGDARADSALEGSGSRRGGALELPPLYAVVFDERFAQAIRFGREAGRLGLPVRGLQGDVTDFWYAELHPLWKRQPRPIAGLTAYAALFCLERLAWDHGMRVVYHGEHARLASGEVEHVLYGPAARPAPGTLDTGPFPVAHGASDDRADWPAEIASMIARTESRSAWSGLPPARRAVQSRFLTPGSPREQSVGQPLHSWVIAPPARA